MDIRDFLERVLLWTKTPSQYTGGEWNRVQKDLSSMRSTICLCYPDTYPVGMSYHGLKLLYEIVNGHEDLACERVFAPLPDFIGYLEKYEVPLFSLETKTPVRKFDFLGFSISTEINWSNVLEILHLSRIPIWAAERTEEDPIVIAGGYGVYNPEPAAPFLDIVALGDGEETLPLVLRTDADLKAQHVPRSQRIIELCKKIPGLYAPNGYRVHYRADGTVEEIVPEHGLPEIVHAAYLDDLDRFPTSAPLVGYSDTIHNRIFLEIMRGCTQGCRFCQAGMVRRPMRIKSVDSVIRQACNLYAGTGYEEICLYSLASSDYPFLEELTQKLLQIFASKGVGITLPSLRINEQLKILPSVIASVRKRGLTLAPEVGTPFMQNVVNKPIPIHEMFDTVKEAYRQGWDSIKLYFMLGLPFQPEDDYAAMVDMMHQVSFMRRQTHHREGWVTASVANFVAKPHTPFQWAPMLESEKIVEIQSRIKRSLRSRKIRVDFHAPFATLLEGSISRGNRRMAEVLYRAWKHGAYLDGWKEHFKKEAWEQAFQETGISPSFYLYREIPSHERLPWQHLRGGVSHDFLWREWEKAKNGTITPNCMQGQCNGCGLDPKNCYRPETI